MKAKEFTTACNKENPFMATPIGSITTESLIQWTPPPERWIKLNVDGASKGNPGTAGAGGILRGHYGNWIKGFTLNLGTYLHIC